MKQLFLKTFMVLALATVWGGCGDPSSQAGEAAGEAVDRLPGSQAERAGSCPDGVMVEQAAALPRLVENPWVPLTRSDLEDTAADGRVAGVKVSPSEIERLRGVEGLQQGWAVVHSASGGAMLVVVAGDELPFVVGDCQIGITELLRQLLVESGATDQRAALDSMKDMAVDAPFRDVLEDALTASDEYLKEQNRSWEETPVRERSINPDDAPEEVRADIKALEAEFVLSPELASTRSLIICLHVVGVGNGDCFEASLAADDDSAPGSWPTLMFPVEFTPGAGVEVSAKLESGPETESRVLGTLTRDQLEGGVNNSLRIVISGSSLENSRVTDVSLLGRG